MHTNWQQIDNWSAAYDNRAVVSDPEGIFTAWKNDAAAFRGTNAPLDIAYGDGGRERIDLFHPAGDPQGLCVFIHGGWWSYFGREYFSHLAAGALSRGWSVAMPSYSLCPDINIGGITAQMVQATACACKVAPDGPLVICGHSAGGHLATMMGTCEAGLDGESTNRLKRIVSISGIADLRPLMKTKMNEILNIDKAEARRSSPVFMTPAGGYDYVGCAGADELAEFRRQNALLTGYWGGAVSSRHLEVDGCNHFNVIDLLRTPDSVLTQLMTLG